MRIVLDRTQLDEVWCVLCYARARCPRLVRIPLLGMSRDAVQTLVPKTNWQHDLADLHRGFASGNRVLHLRLLGIVLLPGLASSSMHKTIRQLSKTNIAFDSRQHRHSRCRVPLARSLTAAAATGAAASAAVGAAGAAEQQVYQKQQQQQKPQYSTDAVTAAVFEEQEYEHTRQAEARHNWAANVR